MANSISYEDDGLIVYNYNWGENPETDFISSLIYVDADMQKYNILSIVNRTDEGDLVCRWRQRDFLKVGLSGIESTGNTIQFGVSSVEYLGNPLQIGSDCSVYISCSVNAFTSTVTTAVAKYTITGINSYNGQIERYQDICKK